MTFRMRQTFAISSFNSWYFSNFSSSLSFTLSSPSMAASIMTTSLSFLSVKTMSRLLASIFRSHWTVKSYSILKFSLSTIPSIRLICSYQLLALSNPHLLQSWQSVPCHDLISIMPFIIIIIFFLRCRYNRLFPHRLFLWFRGVGQSTFSILFFIWVFTCLLFTMSSDSIM